MVFVLFDFYKTVFEPIKTEEEAVEDFMDKATEILRGMGFKITWKELRSAFYDTICIFERIRRISLFDTTVDNLMRMFMSTLGIFDEDVMKKLCDIYTNKLVDSVRPYPDAEKSFRLLKEANFKIGVLSNAHQVYFVKKSFEVYGLAHYIDKFIISGSVGIRKPQKQIFQYAIKHLGVEGELGFMIGDNFVADFYGALQAGLEPILIVRDNNLYRVLARVIREEHLARSLLEATEKILSRVRSK